MPASGPTFCASSSWVASRRPNRRSAKDIDHLVLCACGEMWARMITPRTAIIPHTNTESANRVDALCIHTNDVDYWQSLVGLSAHRFQERPAVVFSAAAV